MVVVVVVVGCCLSSDYRTTPVNIVQLCTGLGCGNYQNVKSLIKAEVIKE